MPRPTAIDAANRFRRQLAEQEAASAERMATVYVRIYGNLRNEAESLAEQIAMMDKPKREDIIALARTQELLSQVWQQVTRFGGTVQDELVVITSQATQQGIDNAIELMTASLPPGLPPEIQRALSASFARLPAGAVEAAAGLMAEQSPLRQQLTEKFGEWTANQVERHLTDGIAAGMNPRRIAAMLERNLQEGLGSGLTSALTTIRTAQIKSYQLANQSTYQANSNIVKGWVWHAELGTACLACTAMHGTIHELEEAINGHHNCRCSALPQTITYADLGLDIPEASEPIQTGEDWFNDQPESVQRELMGPGKYEAWQAGEFGFSQLVKDYDDPAYGVLKREATLGELMG